MLTIWRMVSEMSVPLTLQGQDNHPLHRDEAFYYKGVTCLYSPQWNGITALGEKLLMWLLLVLYIISDGGGIRGLCFGCAESATVQPALLWTPLFKLSPGAISLCFHLPVEQQVSKVLRMTISKVVASPIYVLWNEWDKNNFPMIAFPSSVCKFQISLSYHFAQFCTEDAFFCGCVEVCQKLSRDISLCNTM